MVKRAKPKCHLNSSNTSHAGWTTIFHHGFKFCGLHWTHAQTSVNRLKTDHPSSHIAPWMLPILCSTHLGSSRMLSSTHIRTHQYLWINMLSVCSLHIFYLVFSEYFTVLCCCKLPILFDMIFIYLPNQRDLYPTEW